MTYVGGGWALLGNHQIWSYSGRCNMYFQVYAWSEQDAINNRSTVHTRTRILVENKTQTIQVIVLNKIGQLVLQERRITVAMLH